MKWARLTIHHSTSPDVSVEEIRRWHLARGFSDVGYHFCIRKNGMLEIGRPLTRMGAHVKGKNKENIGIVLTGNFQYHPPSDAQYSTLKCVLIVLMHAFGIPNNNIFLHRELANTLCPGKFFNLDKALDKYRPFPS